MSGGSTVKTEAIPTVLKLSGLYRNIALCVMLTALWLVLLAAVSRRAVAQTVHGIESESEPSSAMAMEPTPWHQYPQTELLRTVESWHQRYGDDLRKARSAARVWLKHGVPGSDDIELAISYLRIR